MTKNKKKFDLRNLGSLIALVVLVVVLSIMSKEFRDPQNFVTILRQASVNGLIAFGMTAVILTGAIDLSVGGVLGLTAMLCAGMIRAGIPAVLAMLLALGLGVLFGVISGLFVAKGKLQPFIATLSTLIIYQGVTLIYSNGQPISGVAKGGPLKFIGKGSFLKIPVPIWILIIMFAIFYFVLNHTTYGRHIYAVGSNEKAAKLAGINTDATRVSVYCISGFMAALAGLILLSRLGSAQPTLGSGYELDAIAATALGGTSMNGGRGRISGTVIGVLIIAVLSNGFNIIGLPSYYQNVAKGIIILVAVLADRNNKA